MALAENSGWGPIETLAAIKSRQVKEKNPRLGVDCMQTGSNGEYTRSRFYHSDHMLTTAVNKRYERKLCDRSTDRKAPATPSGYATVSIGFEGEDTDLLPSVPY